MLRSYVLSCQQNQLCGNTEGEKDPLSERFLEFVGNSFKNRAYQSLYRSVICLRKFELCKPEHIVSSFCFLKTFVGLLRIYGVAV